jgi:ribosomal-protein-alanine N-acetyltransferase
VHSYNATTYGQAGLSYIRKPQAVRELSKIDITPFLPEHIDQVHSIETSSFTEPWSKTAILQDAEKDITTYLVATKNNKVVGYMGMWQILDEGHITNIAVHNSYRGEGIANRLINELINIAKTKHITAITLEVRESNTIAKNLYEKHGFTTHGTRKNYYKNPTENAVIMWKSLATQPSEA